MRDRPAAVQALPLALHDQVAQGRSPQLLGARRRRRPGGPLTGKVLLQGRRRPPMKLRRTLATALIAIAALAIGAPAASATFHLMQIREVYPGSAANPG